MIIYDPKNWIRILLDFPRSPVFRTLALDVIAAGAWAVVAVALGYLLVPGAGHVWWWLQGCG